MFSNLKMGICTEIEAYIILSDSNTCNDNIVQLTLQKEEVNRIDCRPKYRPDPKRFTSHCKDLGLHLGTSGIWIS